MTEETSSRATSRPGRRLIRVPDVTPFYDYFAEEALVDRGFEVSYVADYREGFAAAA